MVEGVNKGAVGDREQWVQVGSSLDVGSAGDSQVSGLGDYDKEQNI